MRTSHFNAQNVFKCTVIFVTHGTVTKKKNAHSNRVFTGVSVVKTIMIRQQDVITLLAHVDRITVMNVTKAFHQAKHVINTYQQFMEDILIMLNDLYCLYYFKSADYFQLQV